jgi:nitroreductase
MRLGKRSSQARVNRDLKIEFAAQKLTSYSGLEQLDRFLRRIDLDGRLRGAFARHGISGDYSLTSMVRLLLGLLWIGGRRLSHVDYVCADPLVCRLGRLRLLPHERTLSRWLKQFTYNIDCWAMDLPMVVY